MKVTLQIPLSWDDDRIIAVVQSYEAAGYEVVIQFCTRPLFFFFFFRNGNNPVYERMVKKTNEKEQYVYRCYVFD